MRSILPAAILPCLCALLGCQHDTPPAVAPTPKPAISEHLFGTSRQGRSIQMIRFGSAAPVTLIMAGIHGDESTSCYVADRLIDMLRASPELAGPGSVAVIARANPDGFVLRTRANAQGVDLNRNFAASNWAAAKRGAYYGGPAPQSEPETLALVRVIGELKPHRIISIHSIARGGQCNNYDGPAHHLAAAMSRKNQYPAKATMGYPTPGSLGSWAGVDRKIAVITLELPRNLSGEQAWQANQEALLTAIHHADPPAAK